MAFLKKEKKKYGTYLRMVESYRDEIGKSRHRTIANLGKAEDYSQKTLKKIGRIFLELAGEEYQEKETKTIVEKKRLNYGFVQVYDKIMHHYKLDSLLSNIGKRHNLSYDLYKQILLMLVERLNDPCSKLSNYNNQKEYYGLSGIKLQHLYRSLDYLSENQQHIQAQIYETGRHLFNRKLDVVFYDVTTFYFDSEKEDGFRNKGYSKDGKIGKTVIVFGMLIDKDKNPVGYNVYEGGFYEGHTFKDAIEKLRQEYEIEKVITVADRGMMSKSNIEIVEEQSGYEYIVGERLKNLPNKVKERILNKNNYSETRIIDETTGEIIPLQYLEIEYKGKRIITTYSQKRAEKDRYDRQERIRKGEKMLENQSIAERKAKRSYLTRQGNKEKYVLDEKKIENDAKYDGLASIATNNRELPVEEILNQYRHLYKIEQTFRTFKSYLETRPMFHWTKTRIKGHLCLCYISFTMLNYLINKLRNNNLKLSENKIRKLLRKMQLSEVEIDGQGFYIRSRQSNETKQLINILQLAKVPNFTKTSELNL